MVVTEEDLLRPKDASIKNSDNWPTYTLRRAKCFSKDGNPASLLSAHTNNALRVVGSLDTVDNEYIANVKQPKYRNKVIELKNVTTYAYAEYEDGSYGFWAAGKAGWFELRDPAAGFKETFASMNEATAMFYAISDKTARAYKSHRYMSAKAINNYATVVFKDYLHHGKSFGRRLDVDDVREGVHEHREFLISAMLDAQEGSDWEHAPMYRYFKTKFPDDFAMIEAREVSKSPAKANDAISEKRKEHRTAKSNNGTTRKIAQEDSSQRGRKGKPLKQRPPGKGPQTPSKQIIDVTESLDTTPSSEESHENQGRKAISRKRKSILQPKSNKRSKKGTAKGKSTVDRIDKAEDEDEDVISPDAEQPQPVSPLAEVTKRGPSAMLQQKPPKPKPQPDKQRSSPSSVSSASSPSMPSVLNQQTNNPPNYRPSVALNTIPPLILKEQEPWRCSFDDCTFTVPNELTAQGKAHIHDHFQTHSDQVPGMIDLVLQEARPYLPVGNLVRRLQMFAEAGPV